MGTTLFRVYLNNLPDVIDGLVKIFADDTKIYRAIKSTDTPELLQNNVCKSEYKGGDWNVLYNNMGESFQDNSWIPDFKADFP